ncbi:uncharacterized protein ATC70_012297 [Mucor velutinosus]|uniref:Nucleoplasmin-like domain-containing protein n=1 Tax=Mucor velutinosus TaxID=708070 RepID=A0AAN7HXS1_9FUNG|nr:hypothetical protein ATC70_012297 [Mucor velutinosus]
MHANLLIRTCLGIQIGPQSDQVIKVEASFRITMASIFEFNGPERTSVYMRFQDSTFLLCSLIPEKIEQQVVDITCLQGEEITFRVDGPNVIHLLGNYVSQDGIDDQKDDEIGFLELNGSDVDKPADSILEETLPSITFPVERKGLGFDESDEFGSTSESQAESESESDVASESEPDSEAMPYYNIARLGSYADRLTPTASSTSHDMEDHASPPLDKEGAGRYVLINGNASAHSATEESEPFDQQSDISDAVADHPSLLDSQQHVTETEEQDNVDMDSQTKQVAEDSVPRSEEEPEQGPDHESEQTSEQLSDYEPELEAEQVSEYEQDQVSEYEPEEPQQAPQQAPQQEPQQEQEHESNIELEHVSNHVPEQVPKPEVTFESVIKPTSLSSPELTQQLPLEPAMKLTPKPDQSTQVDSTASMNDKQQSLKKKSNSIPVNTPSPIKKKADKAAKKQTKKLAAALAKQQGSKADSNMEATKQKKAQQSKEKNKIKAKKISKKKQALASKSQTNAQKKSTENSSQDIRSLVLGAFASMTAAIQSVATVEPKPTPVSKTHKIKAADADQDLIPEVVASSALKPNGKLRKSKAPTTLAVSQEDQTTGLGANDLGTIPSTQPTKKKKSAQKPNVAQNDASTAAPVSIGIPTGSPVAVSVPGSARSSLTPNNESPRARYPRRAVDIDSMQKLALFAQEDAKSADSLRKERKKKRFQRADEAVAKKARLSIE